MNSNWRRRHDETELVKGWIRNDGKYRIGEVPCLKKSHGYYADVFVGGFWKQVLKVGSNTTMMTWTTADGAMAYIDRESPMEKKKPGWRKIVYGWMREDRKYRVLRAARKKGSKSKLRYYAEVSQGCRWWVIKTKSGSGKRYWSTPDGATTFIDREYPMSTKKEADNWYVEGGGWYRRDRQFFIQKFSETGKNSRNGGFFVKKHVGNDNWAALRDRGKKTRTWGSFETASKAIDKEFPVSEPTSTEVRVKKTSVRMNFIFECDSADATKMISDFLKDKKISDLDLKVEDHVPAQPRPSRY
jgi:hypothetical protein